MQNRAYVNVKWNTMSRVSNLGGADYQTPLCSSIEAVFRGFLCASATHEDYDPDDIINYGSGEENKGWV